MKTRFLLALAAVLIPAASTTYAFDLDDVVVLSTVGNGEVAIFEKDLNSGTKLAFKTGLGAFDATTGYLGVQSDNKLVTLVDFGPGATNSNWNWRDPEAADPNMPGELPGFADGLGAPAGSLVILNNGAGAQDYIFFGSAAGINNQVRRPAPLDGIATVVADGLNGGPGTYGVGRVGPAVVQSDGDLIFAYQLDPNQPIVSQGRIRRQVGGDLATSGGDEGLGASGSNPIFGLHMDLLSDDTIVLATDDRIVRFRDADTFSPAGLPSTGQFGSDPNVFISGLGVLSDDRVVVATSEGELQLLDTDLTSLQNQFLASGIPGDTDDDGDVDGKDFLTLQRDDPAGIGDWEANYGDPNASGSPLEITAIAVASDDDVIVGTSTGELLRFAYSAGAGTLVQQGSGLNSLGYVMDIDFMNASLPLAAAARAVPEPSAAILLCAGIAVLATMKRSRLVR